MSYRLLRNLRISRVEQVKLLDLKCLNKLGFTKGINLN